MRFLLFSLLCVVANGSAMFPSYTEVYISPVDGSVVMKWELDARDVGQFPLSAADSKVIDFGRAGTARYALEDQFDIQYLGQLVKLDWSMPPFSDSPYAFSSAAGYNFTDIHTNDGKIQISASIVASLRFPHDPPPLIGAYNDGYVDAHFMSFTPDMASATEVPEPSAICLWAMCVAGLTAKIIFGKSDHFSVVAASINKRS
jgi:hypothetical protein